MVMYRLTNQRRLILDKLKEVYNHPTAEDLHEMLVKEMPSIGLATIYRNLDIMEKDGLVLKIKGKDKKAKYDGHTHRHCHLVCKKCGEVFDIDDIEKISINSKKINALGFFLDLDCLTIYGLCKKCKKFIS